MEQETKLNELQTVPQFPGAGNVPACQRGTGAEERHVWVPLTEKQDAELYEELRRHPSVSRDVVVHAALMTWKHGGCSFGKALIEAIKALSDLNEEMLRSVSRMAPSRFTAFDPSPQDIEKIKAIAATAQTGPLLAMPPPASEVREQALEEAAQLMESQDIWTRLIVDVVPPTMRGRKLIADEIRALGLPQGRVHVEAIASDPAVSYFLAAVGADKASGHDISLVAQKPSGPVCHVCGGGPIYEIEFVAGGARRHYCAAHVPDRAYEEALAGTQELPGFEPSGLPSQAVPDGTSDGPAGGLPPVPVTVHRCGRARFLPFSEPPACAKADAAVTCRGCGSPLTGDNGLSDGCACISPPGINHGLVPAHVCACAECDPEQTGAVRPKPETWRDRAPLL